MQMNNFQLANMCTAPGGAAPGGGRATPSPPEPPSYVSVNTTCGSTRHSPKRTNPPTQTEANRQVAARHRARRYTSFEAHRRPKDDCPRHRTAHPEEGSPAGRTPAATASQGAAAKNPGPQKRTRDRGRDPPRRREPRAGQQTQGGGGGYHHLSDSHPHAWRSVAAPQFGRQARAGSACNMI